MTMQDRRVVVTGAGPVSAIGIGREAFFKGLRDARSGIAPIAAFPSDRFVARRAAEVRDFDVRDYLETEKAYLDRMSQFAFAAMSLAVEDANLDLKAMDRSAVGVIFGSAWGSHGSAQFFFGDFLEKGARFVKPIIFPHTYSNTAVSLLAIDYGLDGYHLNIASGLTSSAAAVLQGYDLVRTGRCPLVLAGGADALGPVLLYGYGRAGMLSSSDGTDVCAPFDVRRNGFVLGEGAGMLVLEDADHARCRGARVLGELAGGGIAADVSVRGGDAPPGAGLVRAMRQACRTAASAGGPDIVSAAAHGGRALDSAEAAGLRAFLGERGTAVPVTSLKPMLGETLGADGVLRTIAALGIMNDGFVPPTLNTDMTDPGFGLNLVRSPGLRGAFASVLVNCIDPGGSVVCLTLRGVVA